MNSKITLITAPDIFENGNLSILFVNLSDSEQDLISRWLFEKQLTQDVNFYVFNNETNISWLLFAANRCEHKYMNLDSSSELVVAISSYLLGKTNFSYKVSDENLAAVYSHINSNRVTDVIAFLERTFSE